VEFIDEAVKYIPPKKEPKKQEPKKQEPKKETPKAAPEAAAEEEEEEDKPAPKPKHPLEALGRANFVLDEWKRKYSNSDTRGEALPWFWENANLEEYSLWRVNYKYNSELTLTFMSSNLIG
jgi:elongation factor 1-gamma